MSSTDILRLMDDPDAPRTFKRFKIQFTILASKPLEDSEGKPIAAGSKIAAVVTDISMNGMCFHTPILFEIDSVPIIDITIGIQTFSVPVIVRRCIALQRPGRYVYACGVQYVKSEAAASFIPTLAKYLVSRGLLKAA